MKVAVVGTGIAGNVAAWHLCREHDITVFEAGAHAGGHSHTHDVVLGGRHFAIDTGFIVFNYRTYPHFTRLLQELEVEVQATEMSFSAQCAETGFEYCGRSLNSLFAQRQNLIRPRFYGMLADVLRFNREAARLVDSLDESLTLGEFLRDGGYGREFTRYYLIPMGAAIWSTNPGQMYEFPALCFMRFFQNHGLLDILNRPTWYVIRGGSREYVRKLTAPFVDRIHLHTPVEWVRRPGPGVLLKARGREVEHFDAVFMACHSDQALQLLSDASDQERKVLGAIPYQRNEAVLHTDRRLLPASRRAVAAWNAHVSGDSRQRARLTYSMNILQGLQAPVEFCVTLNSTADIDPDRILAVMEYDHPLFTVDGVSQQARQEDINGQQHTYFCGAYWRHGFHEDGVVSALQAINHFRERESDAQLSLRRLG